MGNLVLGLNLLKFHQKKKPICQIEKTITRIFKHFFIKIYEILRLFQLLDEKHLNHTKTNKDETNINSIHEGQKQQRSPDSIHNATVYFF